VQYENKLKSLQLIEKPISFNSFNSFHTETRKMRQHISYAGKSRLKHIDSLCLHTHRVSLCRG